MRSEPHIAAAAALIGNPGRIAMLGALMDGRALPASELASAAGLSAAGASEHLEPLTILPRSSTSPTLSFWWVDFERSWSG